MIGFLGAGRLGEPMVRRLLGAGHPVSVFARRDEVRARLQGQGAALANSVAELAESADILRRIVATLPICAMVIFAAVQTMPAAQADDDNNTLVSNNKRLNDSVVANVYTVQHRPAAPRTSPSVHNCSSPPNGTPRMS